MKAWALSTWALVILNVAIAAIVSLLWLTPATLEARLRDMAAPSVNLPETVPATPVRSGDFSLLREAAVFHTTRHYIPPPDPAQAVKPAPPPLQWVAVMLLPQGKSIAYVRRAEGGPSLKVRVGENIEGWRVAGIERQRVILELAGETFEITAPASATSKMNPGLAKQ